MKKATSPQSRLSTQPASLKNDKVLTRFDKIRSMTVLNTPIALSGNQLRKPIEGIILKPTHRHPFQSFGIDGGFQ